MLEISSLFLAPNQPGSADFYLSQGQPIWKPFIDPAASTFNLTYPQPIEYFRLREE